MSNGGGPHRAVLLVLLVLLAERDDYGYALAVRARALGWDVPVGYPYRALRDMETAGLVVSSWDVGEAGPARRIYHLEPAGQAAAAAAVGEMERQAATLAATIAAYRPAGGRGRRRMAAATEQP